MKKLRWFAITLFLLSVAVYALNQNQIRRKTDQTIPKISMDQDEIQVSVKDPEKVWKKGITAYDEKDGDITDSLVIESVSTFLEKGRRLVSYAAFDRDGHVAKASRQLIYTDYHSPKISCAKPFSFPVGTQDILDNVYATDCIDGDISNKVEITGDSVFFLNIAGEYEIWLQVTNSCGDMVTVPVTLEMVDYRQQTERTKRAEAAKQTERINLTEKATEETGQKEMEGADSYGAGWNAAVNGYPLNSYFLYRTDGYFKDQAEVDRYYALYGEGKEDLTGVGAGSASRLRPGDTKRLDLNGDYKISGAGNENSDLQYLGDSNPHFVFGFTLGGSWKGIDVNAMFQGVGKQYVIRNDWMAYPFQTRTANQNPTYLGKTWTESNPNAEFPRLTTNANLARWNYQNNDFMMQNNRYIRLKTLIVGYTLPQIWTRKVKLEKVRVYFSGNDLWEATSIRDGFDPEMGAASNNSGYPFARTWSFGLNITL